MRFSTIFIVFAASATAFAGAIIETPAKRSLVDVNAACTVVLNNTLQTTLPEIVNCFDDTCTSTLIDELTDAIDGCDTALTTLPDGSQSASDSVANTFASVITSIATALNAHETTCSSCTDLATEYAKVDSSLSASAQAAFDAYNGLQALVIPLVADVVPILQNISLTLTLAIVS